MSAEFTNISTDLPSKITASGVNRYSGGITRSYPYGSSEVVDSSVSTSTDAVSEETATDKKYTEEELNALTVAQIKAIAAERGYDMKETVKAKLIAEFLTQQG